MTPRRTAWNALLLAALLAAHAEPSAAAVRFRDVADDVFYMYMPIAWRDSDGDTWRYGDFGGMTAALPYLEGLGVTALWMTPIFPSPAYHGYQHGPADQINPGFGTEGQFLDFVAAAHAESVKVFIDLVAYGISHNSVWFQDSHGNPASPYTSWLSWSDPGNTSYLGSTYTTWNGATVGFIHWNLNHPPASQLVTDWSQRWLDPDGDGDPSDGVDGYRLDHVSSNHPTEGPWGYTIAWWQAWKESLRTVNPDVFTFAEQADWGNNGLDLMPAHDATFTKPFEFAVRSALVSGSASGLYASMQTAVSALPAGRTHLCILGDHDVDRLVSVLNSTGRAKAAAAIHLTQPFPPVIYFGDEIGMRGTKADYGSDANDIPFREPFKWNAVAGPPMSNYFALHPQAYANRFSQNNDGRSVEEQQGNPSSLLETYRTLIALRRGHVALRRGDYAGVPASHGSLWAFARVASEESLVVAINVSSSTRNATLDFSAFTVGGASSPVRDLLTGQALSDLTPANQAAYAVSLPPYGYKVLSVRVAPLPPPPARADGLAVPDGFAAAVATQDNATGLGDNLNELNQLFARPDSQEIAIGVTGNLGTDGTGLALFFDTVPGGQNPLDTASFPQPPSGLPQISGMTLDAGFEPDVALFVNAYGGNLYVDHYALESGGGGTKRYLGASVLNAGSGVLSGGDNPGGLELAFDVSNTAGVTATGAEGAATATSGLEAFIPWSDLRLGGPGGTIRILAVVLRSDGYVGNQFLPGLGGGRDNLGAVPIDLNTIPGAQYATVSTALTGAPPPAAPGRLGLEVFPNPAAAAASIRLALPRDEPARIEVYDAGGRRVRDLGRIRPGAGTHLLRWNGRDDRGAATAAGIYFVRVTTPGGTRSARLLRLR